MFFNDIMITLVADAKLRWNAKGGCHPTSACATPISGASNRESGFFVGGPPFNPTMSNCSWSFNPPMNNSPMCNWPKLNAIQ